MRQGENALQVIERVKQKLHDIEAGLPAGVKIVTAYDRSELILRSIDNLKHTLIEELIIVAIVILIFLWHLPSAIIPIITIPVAVIISFIPMQHDGADLEHHVARRDRDRDRRDGGCGHRGGGADPQEARGMGARRAQARLSPRGDRRGEGSGRAELLRAAGDRRRRSCRC